MFTCEVAIINLLIDSDRYHEKSMVPVAHALAQVRSEGNHTDSLCRETWIVFGWTDSDQKGAQFHD